MRDERIGHVVVLMLENRSFDHMLGHLEQGILPPLSEEVDGQRVDPANSSSRFIPVRWVEDYTDVTVDPGHGFCDVMRQLTGTNGAWATPYVLENNGFVWNYATRKGLDGQPPNDVAEIMGCYRADELPALNTLARSFAVCTRWHCSLPSETWPNRLFAHAGTSFGATEFDRLLHTDQTIFGRLEDAGFDSCAYGGDIPQVLTFWPSMKVRLRHLSQFDDDARSGRLPAYTFIEPRHFDTPWWLGGGIGLGGKSNSQHPIARGQLGLISSGYVPRGEALIARVYEALRANPDVWERSLLIVTYDEHGGFYDRWRPETVEPTGDVAENGFLFDLLGPRVPAVIVSPHIDEGVVESDRFFDHTSLSATVRELFDISTPLSGREESAQTLTPLLRRGEPRAADEAPSLADYTSEDFAEPEEIDDRPLDDFQRQLLWLARQVDEAFAPELEVTAETTVRDVADEVLRFVERNYPLPEVA